MFPGADTHDQPAAQAREVLYVRAAALLPDTADIAQVIRLAEWLHTGNGVFLDPVRVTSAAQVLADLEPTHISWGNRSRATRAEFEGHAAQVVVAYLTGGQP